MIDNEYEQRLILYIKERGIEAEHLVFKDSCHSVEEAARAVNATEKDFIKSICLITNEGKLVVAVVKGENRVDTELVGRVLSIKKPRIAKPAEMLELTGYPCGGTPPFGYDATFIIDKRVLEKEVVYAGGGSENSLIRISVEELLKANKGMVCDVSK